MKLESVCFPLTKTTYCSNEINSFLQKERVRPPVPSEVLNTTLWLVKGRKQRYQSSSSPSPASRGGLFRSVSFLFSFHCPQVKHRYLEHRCYRDHTPSLASPSVGSSLEQGLLCIFSWGCFMIPQHSRRWFQWHFWRERDPCFLGERWHGHTPLCWSLPVAVGGFAYCFISDAVS